MNENVDYEQMALDNEGKGGGNADGPSWTGEVDGYAIKEVTMHDNGAAIIVFHQPSDEKGYTTKLFLNPVDEDKIQPYGKLTKEGAIVQAYENENRLFRSLARQYASDEVVATTFKGVKGFENKVNAFKSLLPDNVAEVTGRVVIGYNAKGYLAFPNKLKWSAEDKQFLPFFTTDDTQKLQPLPSNLTRNKVQPSTEVGEAEVTTVKY